MCVGSSGRNPWTESCTRFMSRVARDGAPTLPPPEPPRPGHLLKPERPGGSRRESRPAPVGWRHFNV